MSGGNASGLVAGISIDLKRLHETWMEIVYPRQVDADETVLGKWTPSSRRSRITYRLWGIAGVPVIGLLYPFVLLGYVVRAQADRLDGVAARLGAIGVVGALAVLWGGLSIVAWDQFTRAGFIAVLAASLVAVVAGLLAYLFRRVGGRFTTVLVAYPLGVTALFLPPVVAALYSPTIADVVFAQSEAVAKWINTNLLDVFDINDRLRRTYDLRGVAHVGMWVGISVPVGWLVGFVVTLANLVRPSRPE
ncbi:hypothetical protein Hrd1104_04770 [Halorhabdus sp. CBA1104]|uniref:hypothetical protein n=1 Tax=unclassified Halorhabdus TaxID=2621901 RepID=UPI0012B209C1|nr:MULTISPECIES: hypothetical protein [unclassified Halorhabdus]QGN06674.1 hypothetical protein Hrd1104_04770 [Halorhabdus sp. CBA1104]